MLNGISCLKVACLLPKVFKSSGSTSATGCPGLPPNEGGFPRASLIDYNSHLRARIIFVSFGRFICLSKKSIALKTTHRASFLSTDCLFVNYQSVISESVTNRPKQRREMTRAAWDQNKCKQEGKVFRSPPLASETPLLHLWAVSYLIDMMVSCAT